LQRSTETAKKTDNSAVLTQNGLSDETVAKEIAKTDCETVKTHSNQPVSVPEVNEISKQFLLNE